MFISDFFRDFFNDRPYVIFGQPLGLGKRTQKVSIFLGRRFHGILNTCPAHLRLHLHITKSIGSNNKQISSFNVKDFGMYPGHVTHFSDTLMAEGS